MKKVLSVVCTLVMVLTLSMASVFALNSASVNGTVESFTINGEAADDKYMQFEADYDDVTGTVLDEIEQLNEGTKISDVLDTTKLINTAKADLPKLVLLTRVQNLVVRNKSDNALVNGVTNVRASWEVPNLTDKLGKIYVLHYSVKRNVWEVIDPVDVNYANKIVTVDFEDLSPVAVAYVPVSQDDETGTKDDTQTGDDTNVMLYAGIGIVALVAIGAIVYKVKKHD